MMMITLRTKCFKWTVQPDVACLARVGWGALISSEPSRFSVGFAVQENSTWLAYFCIACSSFSLFSTLKPEYSVEDCILCSLWHRIAYIFIPDPSFRPAEVLHLAFFFAPAAKQDETWVLEILFYQTWAKHRALQEPFYRSTFKHTFFGNHNQSQGCPSINGSLMAAISIEEFRHWFPD